MDGLKHGLAGLPANYFIGQAGWTYGGALLAGHAPLVEIAIRLRRPRMGDGKAFAKEDKK